MVSVDLVEKLLPVGVFKELNGVAERAYVACQWLELVHGVRPANGSLVERA